MVVPQAINSHASMPELPINNCISCPTSPPLPTNYPGTRLPSCFTMTDLSPGQVITLTDGRQATVRFVGDTHFAAGDWIGIELDDATGKNDGAVQGERYFDCEPGYGMFVRPPAISAVVDRPAREPKPPQPKGTGNTPSRGRAQTGIVAGSMGLKKPGTLPSSNIKRNSASAASPSPAPKTTSQRTSLRVCVADESQWFNTR